LSIENTSPILPKQVKYLWQCVLALAEPELWVCEAVFNLFFVIDTISRFFNYLAERMTRSPVYSALICFLSSGAWQNEIFSGGGLAVTKDLLF
jgi:hypothetical protein